MIDLRRNRNEFLVEIGALASADAPVREPTDRRVTAEDAIVRLRGHTRAELFPILEVILSERFAVVPRLQLIRDLLMPLNHALGNAFKHGHKKDSSKTIHVELVLARFGVLAAISDEGPGFDVSRTFARFLSQFDYFENGGDGFRSLHLAGSVTSFENAGRTLLLCFRPQTHLETEGNGDCDVDRSRALFPSVPATGGGFRVFDARARAGDECGIRFVMAQPPRILTGRLHATPADALADIQASIALNEADPLDHVRIPRPIAQSGSEPRLVLFDFHPWMNLREYLAYWNKFSTVQHAARRIGRALAQLHRSRIAPGNVQFSAVEDRMKLSSERAMRHLQTLHDAAELRQQFEDSVLTMLERMALRRRQTLTPIHGAFGWDCVHFAVDRHFYFHRFERCRWGDPGLDLGGFGADLLSCSLAHDDGESYQYCRDELMEAYNAEAELPIRLDELCFHVALAIVERLAKARTRGQVEHLVAALDVACEFAEADVCPR